MEGGGRLVWMNGNPGGKIITKLFVSEAKNRTVFLF
jgi:hypothetical protein